MKCAHCGAEVSDREEICTLCGKLAKVTGETPEPDISTPAPSPVTGSDEGAAFCSECKKYVYLDSSGCCYQGHPVSSMSSQGSQLPDQVPRESMYANNSGLGAGSSLPAELKGINWGAFLLTWIWGIGNRVWLSFLVFIPGGNYVMPWVLLIKGNEWAWKNRHWRSVQEFRKVQRKWALVGIIVTVVLIVLACSLYFVLASAGVFSQHGQAGGAQVS